MKLLLKTALIVPLLSLWIATSAQSDFNPYNSYFPTTLEGYALGIIQYTYERGRIYELYEQWEPVAVIDKLLDLYSRPEKEVARPKILVLLSDVRERNLTTFFSQQLQQKEYGTRAGAIFALGKQGDPAAVPALEQYLNSNGADMLIPQVINALGLISTERANEVLATFANKYPSKEYWHEYVQITRRRMIQYQSAPNKRRHFKALLQTEKGDFFWAIDKMYQANSNVPRAAFLRKISNRLAGNGQMLSEHLRLLSLRESLNYKLSDEEQGLLERHKPTCE